MKLMNTKIALLLFTSFIVIGCSEPSPSASPQQEKIAKSFKTSSNYSNLYIYTKAYTGPLGAAVFIDQKLIGHLNQSTFFLAKVKPGRHNIVYSLSPTYFNTTLTTKANNNYFVEFHNDTSWRAKERFSLKQVSKRIGKTQVSQLKMLKPSKSSASYTKQKTSYKATQISPVPYRKYSCNKLKKSILSVNSQLNGLIKVNDQNKLVGGLATVAMAGASATAFYQTSQSPKMIEATGTVIPGRTPLMMPTSNTPINNSSISGQISSLLGQYDAMKIVAKEKKCGFASKLK